MEVTHEDNVRCLYIAQSKTDKFHKFGKRHVPIHLLYAPLIDTLIEKSSGEYLLDIIPSKYEGHPKTLLEAMACGIPVIGADVMGIRDIISDKSNGLLYDGTTEDLIRNLNQLLANSELQIKIIDNARKFIKKNYDIKNIANEEYKLLGKLACI